MANKNVVSYTLSQIKFIASYSFNTTSLENTFSHGIITCTSAPTTEQKLQVLDALRSFSNGSIEGQIFGNTIAVFNDSIFSYVKKTGKTYNFVR